ncbi:hypothetical protein [Neptunitalea lumnitzerae]|uniref:C1q domain-containing protein n=1 Tax=Neptunitalea lumnitzerae TaxID=2965509 RepID=A0ABQ5MGA6_9FLAO|nr:hypothetical protein [Neptunitalea sp. Y10]GLB48423.1 hypothetical protein Y10_07910 [Neptunitalea sp. Y10]
MNKLITLGIALIGYATFAQVGINTTAPQANLDVEGRPTETSTPDGIIPPKLTRSQLIAKTAYGTNQKGAIVYVTDVSGTTNASTANVTAVGMYFFDGSVWQRLDMYETTSHNIATSGNTLTSTVDGTDYTATVVNSVVNASNNNNFSTAVNGVTGSGVSLITSNSLAVANNTVNSSLNGVTSNTITVPNLYTVNGSLNGNRVVSLANNALSFTSTATTGTSHFTIDGNTFNVDAVNNRVGVGNNSPVANLDIRANPGDTTNPGEGYLGIGTTSTAATTAGAGAIRYTTTDGGGIEYSNGVVWNALESTVQKSIIIAKKTASQTVSNNSETNITNWIEITDLNGDYNPSTGVFTAPRDGSYVVSFSFNFSQGSIADNSQVEAQLKYTDGGSTSSMKSVVAFPAGGTAQAGAVISFTVQLDAGETVRPVIWHSLGGNRSLRVPGSIYDDGFNNFSVVEL